MSSPNYEGALSTCCLTLLHFSRINPSHYQSILLPWVILTVFHDLVHHFDTVTVGAVGDEVKGALTEAVYGIDITSPFHQVLGDLKPTLLQRQQKGRLPRSIYTVYVCSCKLRIVHSLILTFCGVFSKNNYHVK